MFGRRESSGLPGLGAALRPGGRVQQGLSAIMSEVGTEIAHVPRMALSESFGCQNDRQIDLKGGVA